MNSKFKNCRFDVTKFPLWTAVVTPMQSNGQLDFESLEILLKEQERAQNGLLILGSTGEALNLDLKERKRIVEYVNALDLKVPVMQGIGGFNLNETLEWLTYLENLKNIDAYLMVTPLYAKPGKFGQYEWFKTLMDNASRPVMLYNIPSRAGVSLNVESVTMLKDHPNFWSIKEASGSVEEFKKYKNAVPHISVFSGDDGMTPHFSKFGCSGLVSVCSNVWPTATNLFTRYAMEQRLSEIEIKLWEEATDTLFLKSNPIPVKRLLFENKKINTSVMRLPLINKEITEDDLLKMQNAHKNICNWEKEKKESYGRQ